MWRRFLLSATTAGLLASVTACSPGSVRLQPRAPQATKAGHPGVSSVVVEVSPENTGKKAAILAERQVVQGMQRAVLHSFSMAGQQRSEGVIVRTKIVGVRASGWGPAVLSVEVRVTDRAGVELRQFDLTSSSIGGDRVQRTIQDIVDKIVDHVRAPG